VASSKKRRFWRDWRINGFLNAPIMGSTSDNLKNKHFGGSAILVILSV